MDGLPQRGEYLIVPLQGHLLRVVSADAQFFHRNDFGILQKFFELLRMAHPNLGGVRACHFRSAGGKNPGE